MPFKSSARGSYGPQGQKVIKGPLAPVWTTFSPGAVGTDAFSYTFVATDDSGDAPTYSVASGALPTGLTLNNTTGVLSGTATASGTFTYTLRATDVNGRSTDTTSISQVVSLSLYTFPSPSTFGAGGNTGQSGPSIGTARASLGNPSWANTYLNMSTTGIQEWTVPVTGTYRMLAVGASGAPCNQTGGYGSGAQADIALTQGEIIKIVIGQQGGQPSLSANGGPSGGGGGGATYVWRNSNGQALIVGAGGGGAGGPSNGGNGQGISTSAVAGSSPGGSAGGLCFGGNGGFNSGGGGGGGFGLSGNFNGGTAGQGGNGSGGNGGFGGGGGGAASNCYNNGGTGGGGGYQGGNGGNESACTQQGSRNSFGGYSYTGVGTNVSNNTTYNNNANGYLTVTKL